MTELIHMSDNYVREFDATVIGSGDGYVVLDKTAFYPEGGGQSTDHGELSDSKRTLTVKEVRKIEGEIRHLVDGQSFEIGASVTVWKQKGTISNLEKVELIIRR